MEKSFIVDVFIGNVIDWEKVCMGNFVGLLVLVILIGFKNILELLIKSCCRRIMINVGIYVFFECDYIVSYMLFFEMKF